MRRIVIDDLEGDSSASGWHDICQLSVEYLTKEEEGDIPAITVELKRHRYQDDKVAVEDSIVLMNLSDAEAELLSQFLIMAVQWRKRETASPPSA
jgi:hypothetical protein